MKIAIDIYNEKYANSWIEYCKSKDIPYVIVSLYDDHLMKMIEDVTHFLAVPTLGDRNTCEYAKSILHCLGQRGIKVFPNYESFWHYDDKVAQKYLLESIDAPLVKSHVFYDRRKAMEWVENETSYPFVFKLKAGAGSSNVKLIRTKFQARKQVNRMFGRGEVAVPSYFADLGTKVKNTRSSGNFLVKLQRAPRVIKKLIQRRSTTPREIQYFYTQEFLSGNEWDTRITVVGDKAYGFRRFVRSGDFRASGSGSICWDHKKIEIKCIKIAHEVSKRMGFICMAYDFINDHKGEPQIVEISYTFLPHAVNQCPGYWDAKGQFHSETKVDVQLLVLRNLLNK